MSSKFQYLDIIANDTVKCLTNLSRWWPVTKKEPKIFKGKNKELSKNNVYSVQQERNHIIPFSRSKLKKFQIIAKAVKCRPKWRTKRNLEISQIPLTKKLLNWYMSQCIGQHNYTKWTNTQYNFDVVINFERWVWSKLAYMI